MLFVYEHICLVVLTILKNMSSSMVGGLSHIYIMENKSHVWNHQPDTIWYDWPSIVLNIDYYR